MVGTVRSTSARRGARGNGRPTARRVVEEGRRRLLPFTELFARSGDERLQARELLEYAAGVELDDDDLIDAAVRERFDELIERRTTGEPVAYIRGFEEFRGLRLEVKRGAFVPRQSSEFLAEQAIRRLRRRARPVAADIATGVGAVAMAIANELPSATVYGTDISDDALQLARGNARAARISNARFLRGSMFDPLPKRLKGSLDVITSHPPYISAIELPEMPKELLEFEPVHSLTDASEDGLGLVRLLVFGSREWLKPGGWLCVEVAPDVVRKVRPMIVRAGFTDVASRRGGWESRVVIGKR